MSFRTRMAASAPICWLRVGEASGTVAADQSGEGNAGAYVNTPTLGEPSLIDGDDDTAIRLTAASSEYVAVTNFTTGLAAFTVMCRVKLASTIDGQRLMAQRGPSGTWFDMFLDSARGIALYDGTTSHASTAEKMTVGTAQTVALVVEAGTHVVYLDGVSVGSGAWTNNTTTDDLTFGNYAFGSAPLDATIDEPALWNRALSAIEVAALHADAVDAPAEGDGGGTMGLSMGMGL